MKRRHVWMELETCGDSWKVVKNVLIFIYTPVISLSLANKPSTQRIELLALYHPPSHCCPFGAVFALILEKLCAIFPDFLTLLCVVQIGWVVQANMGILFYVSPYFQSWKRQFLRTRVRHVGFDG